MKHKLHWTDDQIVAYWPNIEQVINTNKQSHCMLSSNVMHYN